MGVINCLKGVIKRFNNHIYETLITGSIQELIVVTEPGRHLSFPLYIVGMYTRTSLDGRVQQLWLLLLLYGILILLWMAECSNCSCCCYYTVYSYFSGGPSVATVAACCYYCTVYSYSCIRAITRGIATTYVQTWSQASEATWLELCVYICNGEQVSSILWKFRVKLYQFTVSV